jgi:hypothetical protein
LAKWALGIGLNFIISTSEINKRDRPTVAPNRTESSVEAPYIPGCMEAGRNMRRRNAASILMAAYPRNFATAPPIEGRRVAAR